MSKDFQIYPQLVLRVPEVLSSKISDIANGSFGRKHIEVFPQGFHICFSDKIFIMRCLLYLHLDFNNPSDEFLFCVEDNIFPALLVILPCNVETYKTADHLTYYKSGDIGQVLD